jgi:hypothetical protein
MAVVRSLYLSSGMAKMGGMERKAGTWAKKACWWNDTRKEGVMMVGVS